MLMQVSFDPRQPRTDPAPKSAPSSSLPSVSRSAKGVLPGKIDAVLAHLKSAAKRPAQTQALAAGNNKATSVQAPEQKDARKRLAVEAVADGSVAVESADSGDRSARAGEGGADQGGEEEAIEQLLEDENHEAEVTLKTEVEAAEAEARRRVHEAEVVAKARVDGARHMAERMMQEHERKGTSARSGVAAASTKAPSATAKELPQIDDPFVQGEEPEAEESSFTSMEVDERGGTSRQAQSGSHGEQEEWDTPQDSVIAGVEAHSEDDAGVGTETEGADLPNPAGLYLRALMPMVLLTVLLLAMERKAPNSRADGPAAAAAMAGEFHGEEAARPRVASPCPAAG